MNPTAIMAELNIDETPANTALITSLVGQAQDIIIHSVDSTQTVDDYKDNLIFQRAAITLVTQLYYDRTLSNGLSIGLQMMINHLKGQVVVSDN